MVLHFYLMLLVTHNPVCYMKMVDTDIIINANVGMTYPWALGTVNCYYKLNNALNLEFFNYEWYFIYNDFLFFAKWYSCCVLYSFEDTLWKRNRCNRFCESISIQRMQIFHILL